MSETISSENATALGQAIAKAGSRAALARKVGVTKGAVYQWEQVPVGKLGKVSAVTGMTPQELRPDVFRGATVAA